MQQFIARHHRSPAAAARVERLRARLVRLSLLVPALALAACSASTGDGNAVGESELITTATESFLDDLAPQVLGDSVLWMRPGPNGRALQVVKARAQGPVEVVFTLPPSMEGVGVAGEGMTLGGASATVDGRVYFGMYWTEPSHNANNAWSGIARSGLLETDGTSAGTRVVEGGSHFSACGHAVYRFGERLVPGGAPQPAPSNVVGNEEQRWCVGNTVMVVSTTQSSAAGTTRRFYRWNDDGTATELPMPELPTYAQNLPHAFALLGDAIVPLYDLWPGPPGLYDHPDASQPELRDLTRMNWLDNVREVGVVKDAGGTARVAFRVGDTAFGVTDGTHGGTHLYRDLSPNAGSWGLMDVAIVGNVARGLVITNAGRAFAFFESDGTAAGTMVREALPASPFAAYNRDLSVSRGPGAWAFVVPSNYNRTLDVWTSDWTAAGTVHVDTVSLPDADTASGFRGWNGVSAVGYATALPGGLVVPYVTDWTGEVRLLRLHF